jgi:hypothetical protein
MSLARSAFLARFSMPKGNEIREAKGLLDLGFGALAPSGGIEALEDLESCGRVWGNMLDGLGADDSALELENLFALEGIARGALEEAFPCALALFRWNH